MNYVHKRMKIAAKEHKDRKRGTFSPRPLFDISACPATAATFFCGNSPSEIRVDQCPSVVPFPLTALPFASPHPWTRSDTLIHDNSHWFTLFLGGPPPCSPFAPVQKSFASSAVPANAGIPKIPQIPRRKPLPSRKSQESHTSHLPRITRPSAASSRVFPHPQNLQKPLQSHLFPHRPGFLFQKISNPTFPCAPNARHD
jgi:hypothetical protein